MLVTRLKQAPSSIPIPFPVGRTPAQRVPKSLILFGLPLSMRHGLLSRIYVVLRLPNSVSILVQMVVIVPISFPLTLSLVVLGACVSPRKAHGLTNMGPALMFRDPVLPNLLNGPAEPSPTLVDGLILGIRQRQPAANYPPTGSVAILFPLFRQLCVTVKSALLRLLKVRCRQCRGTMPSRTVALSTRLQQSKLPSVTRLTLVVRRSS